MQLLIATHNAGKLREYAQLLMGLPLQLVSLSDIGIDWDVAETGDSFERNARLKAEGYCHASGLLTLADDSGLEVDALHGAPGVYSARYGNQPTDVERYRLALSQLHDVPDEQRRARFRCVIAIARPQQPTQFAEGVCHGFIAREPRGANGFGYDPIFWLPERGQTIAELSDAEKNQISHRGRAARRAVEILKRLLQ